MHVAPWLPLSHFVHCGYLSSNSFAHFQVGGCWQNVGELVGAEEGLLVLLVSNQHRLVFKSFAWFWRPSIVVRKSVLPMPMPFSGFGVFVKGSAVPEGPTPLNHLLLSAEQTSITVGTVEQRSRFESKHSLQPSKVGMRGHHALAHEMLNTKASTVRRRRTRMKLAQIAP